MLIPGLLQTPDYARYRALEAVRLHSTAAEQVDETVVARIRRQEVLYDTSKTFEFIVCEAAFRYLLCPPQVMRGQLDRPRYRKASLAVLRWPQPVTSRIRLLP